MLLSRTEDLIIYATRRARTDGGRFFLGSLSIEFVHVVDPCQNAIYVRHIRGPSEGERVHESMETMRPRHILARCDSEAVYLGATAPAV